MVGLHSTPPESPARPFADGSPVADDATKSTTSASSTTTAAAAVASSSSSSSLLSARRSRSTPTLPEAGGDVAVAASSIRVLFVEDASSNRKLGFRVLSRAGFSVVTAENGREAVETVLSSADDPFTVVFMDVHMPVMDGLEATRILRDRGFSVPIVALTGNATSGDRESCLEAGCTSFCTKPISAERLTSVVWEIVGSGVVSSGGGGVGATVSSSASSSSSSSSSSSPV